MPDAPVPLTIGGQCYRVHTDADPKLLDRLAQQLDDRIARCNPTGRLTPIQALVYAALTLAEDLEQERIARTELQSRTRDNLENVLRRIDAAVAATDSLLGGHHPC